MPSADFCLITFKVTLVGAIGFHLVRSFQSMTLKSQGTCIPEPHWLITDRLLSRSPQIRAWTVSALLHHLRWPLDHMVSLSCANSPSAYASYDVLVHQLADLLAASSRQALTGLPLPFASSYHLIAILIAKDGDLPTEDFHLISSCPCWAYTRRSTGFHNLSRLLQKDAKVRAKLFHR